MARSKQKHVETLHGARTPIRRQDNRAALVTGATGATGPTGPAAAWGTITGTLSAQTDLQTALNLKAPLASPALTGTPTAPTAAPGTNTTQIASTAFVVAADALDEKIANKNAASGYAGLSAGSKLTGSQQTYGSTANTAAEGNDARLSDARTPTAHATSHKSGGSDAIKLDEFAAPTDVTTLNASTTAHGLMPKWDNSAAHFFNGQGAQVQVPLATAVSGDLPVANLSNGTYTVVDSTATGAQNNWAPGLDGNTLVTWHGAADIAITGIAGGVVGQVFVLKNTGTKIATFAHNSGSSSAGNKLFNPVTSAPTPAAAGGHLAYQHDGTQWQQISHAQGAPITRTFAGTNYTGSGSMTVTVDAGDVTTDAYVIVGTKMFYAWYLDLFSISGTPSADVRILIPGSFSAARSVWDSIGYIGDNGVSKPGYCSINVGTPTLVVLEKSDFSAWAASSNNTSSYGLLPIDLV